MKESHNRKRILLILLWVLIVLILLLAAINAFFIWQLYFTAPADSSKDDLVNQTLTSVSLTEISLVEEVTHTLTPEPPTVTPQPTDTPIPATETLSEVREEVLYTIRQGDSLQNLSESFAVTIEDLRARNQMLGDFILVDQKIYIPPEGETYEPSLDFSSMTSDDAYFLMPQAASNQEPTFDFYMEENRLAFHAREQLEQRTTDAFFFVADQLGGGDAPALITVYYGSGPFHRDNAVRAVFIPDEEPESRLYVLHDGSGDLVDLNFHLAYGMARLWGDEVWGGTPDPVLREGMAYAIADERNLGSGNLRLCDVAFAYQDMGKLPDLTLVNNLDVPWTLNMVNLTTAGCYYQYLSGQYSPEEMQALFMSGDYSSLPTGTFNAAFASFTDWLPSYQTSQPIETADFVERMDRLLYMNRLFFPDMASWEYRFKTYYALDQARLGIWRNDLRYALVRMNTAAAMLGLTNNVEVPAPEITLTPDPDGQSQPPTPTQEGFQTWTPWPTPEPWWKPDPDEDD